MGIFSHFRKKNQQPDHAGDQSSSSGRRGTDERDLPGNTLDHLSNATTTQRDIARATALKIDAIESEMTFEFVNTVPATQSGNTISPPASKAFSAAPTMPANIAIAPPPIADATVPLLELPPEAPLVAPAADAAEIATLPTTPAIDEAAILFANGQTAVAEQILQEAVRDETPGDAVRTAWSMLFDLYRVTGGREQFDALSIAYAGKFETSPPAWTEAPALAAQNVVASKPAATPSVAFSGVLDAQITKQLARAQKLAESHPALRLEFIRVSAVDPVGCGLLLRVLKKLQKSGLELILVGAPELAARIRMILQVGRRDETEAPWLLLLEILRLLNREQEFEESSIDYCVTFEVSPPAFVAPQTRVTTAQDESAPSESADRATPVDDAFVMPLVVDGDTRQLIQAITAHAGAHDPLVLDCSHLARIDFSAAGQLLNGLAPLARKAVELHNVNHLVAALLYVLGMQHIARIIPRKN